MKKPWEIVLFLLTTKRYWVYNVLLYLVFWNLKEDNNDF